jgi:hypothetical protein
MPLWMWLNIPLMILVIAAVVGIPYWLVLRHPDQDAPRLRRSARTASAPVTIPVQTRPGQRVPSADERYGDERYGDRVQAGNGRRYDFDYSTR